MQIHTKCFTISTTWKLLLIHTHMKNMHRKSSFVSSSSSQRRASTPTATIQPDTTNNKNVFLQVPQNQNQQLRRQSSASSSRLNNNIRRRSSFRGENNQSGSGLSSEIPSSATTISKHQVPPSVLVKAFFFVAQQQQQPKSRKSPWRSEEQYQEEEEEEEDTNITTLERLNSENGVAVTTIFRWQPPSSSSSLANSSSSSSSLFNGAWSSLENLFSPLHSSTATDDEIDRKDEFLRHLTWDELSIADDCIFVPNARDGDPENEKINMIKTKSLLSNMISSSLLAHGSIVVCSPLAKFSHETLTQPTRVKDFVDGSSCIAVFISEYQFRTKILEPFSQALLELKKQKNLAMARVRAGGGGGRNGSKKRRARDFLRNDDQQEDNEDNDEDFKDFISHVFQSADVTPIDILQFSSDSVRVAESSAECQRTIPGLMKKDIARRRKENLKRFDQQLRIQEEQNVARGALRTEMVLARREQDQVREQHLSRGTTTLIGAHRYYEHVQRDFEEKLAMTAATLPPKKYDQKGNDISLLARKQFQEQEKVMRKHRRMLTSESTFGSAGYSSSNFIDLDHFYSSDNKGVIGVYHDQQQQQQQQQAEQNNSSTTTLVLTEEQKKRDASATVISSQLFGGRVALQFSRHLSIDDHHAKRFVQDKYKENQEQRSQLAKYKRDMLKKQKQQQHGKYGGKNENNSHEQDADDDGANTNNNTLLSRDLTDDERMELRLKKNIERLDRECHDDVEQAASVVKEEMQSRLQTRRKLRENAAVEQGVIDSMKGKERIRHRLAIERAAVLSMKDLIEETGKDDRVGRRDDDIKMRITSTSKGSQMMMSLPSMTVVPVD